MLTNIETSNLKQGQPLLIGIYIDAIYDVGRVEDIHWNPWFSTQKTLFGWQLANGRAFVLGRSDWEYLLFYFYYYFYFTFLFYSCFFNLVNVYV
jgi:hypothetical protein